MSANLDKMNEPDQDQDSEDYHELAVSASHYFSGPIPDPYTLERYEKILPGAAERCFKMAEEQAKHRQSEEVLNNKREDQQAKLSIAIAGIVVLGFILLAAYMIYLSQPLAAVITTLIVVIALVWLFLKGKQINIEADLATQKAIIQLQETNDRQ